MSDQNLESSFDKKGMILALPPAGVSNIEESSIDHAIEAGAEEVSPLGEDNKLTVSACKCFIIYIYCN